MTHVVDIDLLKVATYSEVPARILAPFVAPLQQTVERFGLAERSVLAAFVATIAHESASFQALREFDPGDRYEGRLSLGNTEPGDGRKFRGRGLIQLTGRHNVTRCADFFSKTLEECLVWLETPEGAALSAGWYFAWHRPECVRAAKAGDFVRVCKIVNGGTVGLKDRTARYAEILRWLDREGAPAGRWPK